MCLLIHLKKLSSLPLNYKISVMIFSLIVASCGKAESKRSQNSNTPDHASPQQEAEETPQTKSPQPTKSLQPNESPQPKNTQPKNIQPTKSNHNEASKPSSSQRTTLPAQDEKNLLAYPNLAEWISPEFCHSSQFPETCLDPPTLPSRPLRPETPDLSFTPVMEPLLTAATLHHTQAKFITDGTEDSHAFNCSHVKELMATTYLWDVQYAGIHEPITETFMKNVLKTYLSELDYLQIYFLQEDVDGFLSKYPSSMWEDISEGHCAFLNEIHQVYKKRYQERAPTLISALYHLGTSTTHPTQKNSPPSKKQPHLAGTSLDENSQKVPMFAHSKNVQIRVFQRISALSDFIQDEKCNYSGNLLLYSRLAHRSSCKIERGRQQKLIMALNAHIKKHNDGEITADSVKKALFDVMPHFDEKIVEKTDGLNPYHTFLQAFFWSYEKENLLCEDVYQAIGTAFSTHLKYKNATSPFTPEYAQEMLKKYITYLDPYGLYFLKEDVDLILSQYAKQMRNKIINRQCQPILEIARIFKQRVLEHYPKIKANIFKDHDYSLDELVPRVMGVEGYPTADELDDTLRRRVKFILWLRWKQQEDKEAELLFQTRTTLLQDMKKTLDRAHELDSTEIYSKFINSALSVMDPHTNFAFDRAAERLSSQISGEFSGLGVGFEEGDDDLKVTNILKDGAVEESGEIAIGDLIVAVRQDNPEAPWMNINDFVNPYDRISALRGPSGSIVHLRLRRPLEQEHSFLEFEVAIKRKKVMAQTNIAPHHLFEVPHSFGTKDIQVGWVKLDKFYPHLPGQKHRGTGFATGEAIAKLKEQGADVVVIDVRDNAGGALDEALETIGLFTRPKAALMAEWSHPVRHPSSQSSSVDPDDPTFEYLNPDHLTHDHLAIPVIILINSKSASASEILAQSMVANGRGLVVGGPRTFGKGTVQQMMPNFLMPVVVRNLTLPLLKSGRENLFTSYIPHKKNSSFLKNTRALYFGSDGNSVQQIGISSDILIPSLADLNLIDMDRTHHLEYTQAGRDLSLNLGFRHEDLISKLKTLSKERIAQDPYFIEVESLIAFRQKKNDSEDDLVEWEAEKENKLASEKLYMETMTYLSKLYYKWFQQEAPASLADDIREHDAVLQQALFLAADYYMLCRHGMNPQNPKAPLVQSPEEQKLGCFIKEEQPIKEDSADQIIDSAPEASSQEQD